MVERTAEATPASSGVDALITRLRDEGVAAGREQADQLLADARQQAHAIIEAAEADARQRVESARKQAAADLAAGQEALRTSMRDAVLEMKSTLNHQFADDVQRLVSAELNDSSLLRRLILEIAGKARAEARVDNGNDVVMLLPEHAIGLEELRENPKELESGQLADLVRGLTGDLLREGVTFEGSDAIEAGVHVKVRDQDVVLDLSDQAVASLLLQHLQPRFRAILEGVVK
ncbi:MAG: hypothetical protein AAF446_00520 [Pseudomonadota bacterium]